VFESRGVGEADLGIDRLGLRGFLLRIADIAFMRQHLRQHVVRLGALRMLDDRLPQLLLGQRVVALLQRGLDFLRTIGCEGRRANQHDQ
jgi:hypothetical protein